MVRLIKESVDFLFMSENLTFLSLVTTRRNLIILSRSSVIIYLSLLLNEGTGVEM